MQQIWEKDIFSLLSGFVLAKLLLFSNLLASSNERLSSSDVYFYLFQILSYQLNHI